MWAGYLGRRWWRTHRGARLIGLLGIVAWNTVAIWSGCRRVRRILRDALHWGWHWVCRWVMIVRMRGR